VDFNFCYFIWKSKQPTQEELAEMFSKIKDTAFVVGKKEASLSQVIELNHPVEDIKSSVSSVVDKKEKS
jgi:hypothetical protein